MTLLPAIIIGVVFVFAYGVLYIYRRKELPNLGVCFLLFLIGPVVNEAWAIGLIFKHSLVDQQPVNMGVFYDHQYAVAFCPFALIWLAVYTLKQIFVPLFKRP